MKRWNSERVPCNAHLCTGNNEGEPGSDYGPATHSRRRTAHKIGAQHRQTHTTAETAHDAARATTALLLVVLVAVVVVVAAAVMVLAVRDQLSQRPTEWQTVSINPA